MIESGALEEVVMLNNRGLDPALPVMRALGVPQLLQYIDQRADLQTAAENAIRATHAYAKRQFTFARHQLLGFRCIPFGEALDNLIDYLMV